VRPSRCAGVANFCRFLDPAESSAGKSGAGRRGGEGLALETEAPRDATSLQKKPTGLAEPRAQAMEEWLEEMVELDEMEHDQMAALELR